MIPDEAELHAAMQRERRHLVSLAYEALGSLPDAEQAVQDTYICWYRLSAEQQAAVAEPHVWMTRALRANQRLRRTTLRHVTGDHNQRFASARRDECVRVLVSRAHRHDIAGLIGLLDPSVRFSAGPSGAGHAHRISITGARRVARHLVSPLQSYPDTAILEQATPHGLSFALWEDGCIVGVAEIEIAVGVAKDIRLLTDPRRLTLWG